MNKLHSIEWLRGVAALWVCLVHIFCAFEFFPKTDLFFHTYLFPLFVAGRAGVYVFFVVSGFVIPYSMYKNRYTLRSAGRFLARRLARLEPPYLLSIVLLLLTMGGVAWLLNRPFAIDVPTVLLHVGYLTIFFDKPWLCGVYWSLAIEFQFYLLIALVYPFLAHRRQLVRLGTFAGLLVAGLAVAPYANLYFIFMYIPFFLLGFSCFLQKVGLIPTRTMLVMWLVLTPILFVVHHKANTFFGVAAAAVIFANLRSPWQPLYYFGRISYSLYLFHWIIGIELLRTLYQATYPSSSEWHRLAFCVLSLGICIVFAELMYRLIEVPSIRWSKRIRPTQASPVDKALVQLADASAV